jgi:hypothetical protein
MKKDVPGPGPSVQHPTPSAGYTYPRPAGQQAQPGFQPRANEGTAEARTRVIDTVLRITAANGQKPARNG